MESEKNKETLPIENTAEVVNYHEMYGNVENKEIVEEKGSK